MPLDTMKQRRPANIVHLPPVTPERGGGDLGASTSRSWTGATERRVLLPEVGVD
jgi:hypothetical protein